MKQNDFFQKNPQNMPTSLRYFRPKWFHLRKVKFKRDILKKKLIFFSKFFLNFFLKIASFFVAKKKKNVEKNIFFFLTKTFCEIGLSILNGLKINMFCKNDFKLKDYTLFEH